MSVTSNKETLRLIGWYLLFGTLHELAHVVTWAVLTQNTLVVDLQFLSRAILGRCCVMDMDNEVATEAIRHAGWLASVLLAVAMSALSDNKATPVSISAWITALEAITTDLMGLFPVSSKGVLFCGNFGIILLNKQWDSKTALDVLEKMVKVTMMRGAQSGGVVTFSDDSKGEIKGIRSRVVNRKRSDLSKLIRRKVERDASPTKIVKGYFGHTRFATSSKASFDGTHPHQWTPQRRRRVYYPFAGKPRLQNVNVENCITHNGDLDFFQVNGKNYDLHTIQQWLEVATGVPIPSTVDSASIAGLMDIIRSQGCFGLSARYAVCLGLPTSSMDPMDHLPFYAEYERIGNIFEAFLNDSLKQWTMEQISASPRLRASLASKILHVVEQDYSKASMRFNGGNLTLPYRALSLFIDDEKGSSLGLFVKVTLDAFFDNDLLNTVKIFLERAKGSFGLVMISSLDAHRQMCIAARGQPMSIAFYPRKGLVCYGSEQAAVKAGLNFALPEGDADVIRGAPRKDNKTLRLDVDDLGGEICLLDWGNEGNMVPAISPPNRTLAVHKFMRDSLNVVLLHQNQAISEHDVRDLSVRMTQIEGSVLVKPLPDEPNDPILSDIQDIPRMCNYIQKDWQDVNLNRLTAWNLRSCLLQRMNGIVDGSISRHAGSVDILLTGCEVSLWLAEQFATDLQKAFPKLFIRTVSSNKILGLYGQELPIPCIGHGWSQKTHDLSDALLIIVSHSGGTFAPLACSNLLQSTTRNIFVVASEWDTQIGKQLRALYDEKDFISSRIFSTGVGVRPAEPCSLSVAATHQLLTNIFGHICLSIISEPKFRHASGAVISEHDLQVLERCNQDNITALEDIVGVDIHGEKLPEEEDPAELELRTAGNVWAEHVLENAKAYVMSFVYIVGTVTSGHPLVSGIATAAGLDASSGFFYLTRFLDSLIYFFLPQINIIILRLLQGRNLRHRMVGRSAIVADCPWVAQAGEAFLSKIFANSYSIAGLNVLSGNPADHLVHRHTHRVVRGSLLVCGRPDGRLSALTSLEAATCLSVNQASSIQSLGGTCESVTIGHNPFKLPLTARAVFLKAHRPKFLCETMLQSIDEQAAAAQQSPAISLILNNKTIQRSSIGNNSMSWSNRFLSVFGLSRGFSNDDEDLPVNSSHGRLLGVYTDLQSKAGKNPLKPDASHQHSVEDIINDLSREKAGIEKLREIFNSLDENGDGELSIEESAHAFQKYDPTFSDFDARMVFMEADVDNSGSLGFDEFVEIAKRPQHQMVDVLKHREEGRGLIKVEPSAESYFGECMRKSAPASLFTFNLSKTQNFAMELYESRIASLQRFVAMTVMFHQMGMRVQTFFCRTSLGFLGYRMDRTHSIMRIATTASPVSGADVRERLEVLRLVTKIRVSVAIIQRAWLRFKQKRTDKIILHLSRSQFLEESGGSFLDDREIEMLKRQGHKQSVNNVPEMKSIKVSQRAAVSSSDDDLSC